MCCSCVGVWGLFLCATAAHPPPPPPQRPPDDALFRGMMLNVDGFVVSACSRAHFRRVLHIKTDKERPVGPRQQQRRSCATVAYSTAEHPAAKTGKEPRLDGKAAAKSGKNKPLNITDIAFALSLHRSYSYHNVGYEYSYHTVS